MTPADEDMNLSQNMDKGKEQSMRHALTSNDNNQVLQEVCNPGHSFTNTEYAERADDNCVFEDAKQLNSFTECVDASSIMNHNDHPRADILLLETNYLKTYKRNRRMQVYQRKRRMQMYQRKRRKFSDLILSRLRYVKGSAGSSLLDVQHNSVRNTLKHSDEIRSSGYFEKMPGDVVGGHSTLLPVAADISVGKASGEYPDAEIASGDREEKIQMGNLKEIVNEQSVERDVSGVEAPEKNLEWVNVDKLNVFHNAVQDSEKARVDKYMTFCEEKVSEDATGDPSAEKLDSDNLEIHPETKYVVSSSSKLGGMTEDVSLVAINKDWPQQMLRSSLGRAALGNFRKKLLVLDVNGLLADIVSYVSERYKPDKYINQKAVFKRPFCDDFLQFCFERFHVGIWSSRTKRNVNYVLDFLMGKSKCNLLFCWDQSHCTDTGFCTVENRNKPLLLKELKKLWDKHEPDLPWERGEFNESNTLLLDDSPCKALLNPPHTAIFPHSYRYKNAKDNSLGPSGDLRVYLEGLASAENVQKYVEQNSFGQRPIRKTNLSWRFYLKVIEAMSPPQREEDTKTSSSPQREEDTKTSSSPQREEDTKTSSSSQREEDAKTSSGCQHRSVE